MGSYRNFVGLVLTSLSVAAGCSNLIGLNGYSVGGLGGESEAGEQSDAGNGGTAAGGSAASAGSAGVSIGESGEGGAASAGQAGSVGDAGAAGKPGACDEDCNDDNDCTDDECVAGKCVHQPLGMTTPCGTGQACDGDGVCVRCLDTAPETENDLGCPVAAPVCVGTGVEAACGGCTKAADCADTNDCTTAQCTDSKCVITAVGAGQMCSSGVCNGAAPEKCVACADTATGGAEDAGCTPAKPVCDPTGNGTCYACIRDSDCATDNVSCTVETCTNHACTHVATDTKCTSSGDACKPSKCDAAAGCTTLTILPTTVSLIAADPSKGNGSFEAGSKPATGWEEDGPYFITKNCNSGCTPGSNNGLTYASTGKVLAWFAGIADADVGDVNRVISLPAGAVSLHVQADTNFQTASKSVANKDYFQVRLMDAAYTQIGAPLYSKSAADAQLGDTHVWTANGIDVTADVTALSGTDVSISFWSSTDTTLLSDFFIDNVRVAVSYCQ